MREEDIGNIAFAFVGGCVEAGFTQATDGACGVVEVEEDGAEAVFAHETDAACDDGPNRVGFYRRAPASRFHSLP